MLNKIPITFVDRLDRTFQLEGEEGQSVASFLLSHHIPLDTVIVECDGNIVSEIDILIRRGDSITIRMVRAYHLPDFLSEFGFALRSTPERGEALSLPSLYTKRVLLFDDDGSAELATKSIDKNRFAEFIEDSFVHCVREKGLIQEGDEIGLALSGGRDSLSLLYLLARTKKFLPSFNLRGVTVCGLSKPLDLEIALEACSSLSITHEFVSTDKVKEYFGLCGTMDTALKALSKQFGRAKSINCVHAFMRTSVERYFAEQSIFKIAYGLHNEDLLASLVRSVVNGFAFGESFYCKSWGPFNLIYPLWGITKKEITIYLDVVAPKKHGGQSSPTPYDRGGYNRDIQYFVADSLQTLWPGFSYHAFEGYQKLFSSAAITLQHNQCLNCGSTYVVDDSESRQLEVCFLCEMLYQVKQVEGGWIE